MLAALINAVTLLLVAVGIGKEAWERCQSPIPIHSGEMLVVASLGLVANGDGAGRGGFGVVGGKRGETSTRASGSQPEHGRTQGKLAVLLVFGLVLFLSAAFAISAVRSTQSRQVSAAPAPVQNADRIDVVYFHRTERCDSCTWAGQMARKTVVSYFANELSSGRVTFREADVQSFENRMLAAKYRATGSSLFLDYVSQGKDYIVEAAQTYPYVGNETRFTGLLRAMIADGLGKN